MIMCTPRNDATRLSLQEATVKVRAPPKPKSLASPAASQIQAVTVSLSVDAPPTSEQSVAAGLASVAAADKMPEKTAQSTAPVAEKRSPPPAPGKRAVPAKPTRMSTSASPAAAPEVCLQIACSSSSVFVGCQIRLIAGRCCFSSRADVPALRGQRIQR
jgi:hypothetical protein